MIDLSEMVGDGLAMLFAPLAYPFDPSRRIFIGFVVVSLILAFWFFYSKSGSRNIIAFFKYIFNKKIWLHKSSILDFKILFANSVFIKIFIIPLIVTKLVIIVSVSSTLRETLGVVESIELSYWVLMLLFTVVIFISEDITRFFLHVFYHRIPWLWEFHKVHHSAEVLTLLTLYRTHPVEIVISRTASVLVLGSVTGIFVFLFPGKLSSIEILGVDALGFLFNAVGANLRHSHIPLSFGKANRWVISPVMHQVHHSKRGIHHDKNFGSCFSIWDRVYGSYYVPRKSERVNFGCNEGGTHTLVEQWVGPFRRLVKNKMVSHKIVFGRGSSIILRNRTNG